MQQHVKYSADIVPLTELKVNPGKIVSQIKKNNRPVLLTSRGRGVAVIQSLRDYEIDSEKREFMRGVVQGFMDLEEGREISLDAANKRLGLS